MTRVKFSISKLEGNFSSSKRGMFLYFRIDIDTVVMVEEGYENHLDNNGKILPLYRLTKKQKRRANLKSKSKINTWERTLPVRDKQDWKYINIKELWERVVKMHEGTLEAKITKRDLTRISFAMLSMHSRRCNNRYACWITFICQGPQCKYNWWIIFNYKVAWI